MSKNCEKVIWVSHHGPNEISAHYEGWENYKSGKEGPNPYEEGSKNWNAWESGWGRAKEEKNVN